MLGYNSLALVCAILIPIFSQTFPWADDKSICNPAGDPAKLCRCNRKFPRYMLISGILQIIYWLFTVLVAINVALGEWGGPRSGWGGEGSSAGMSGVADVLEYLVCCVRLPVGIGLITIPLFTISIMTWVFMFQSDKDCGRELWGFGVFLLVSSLLQACASRSSLLADRR